MRVSILSLPVRWRRGTRLVASLRCSLDWCGHARSKESCSPTQSWRHALDRAFATLLRRRLSSSIELRPAYRFFGSKECRRFLQVGRQSLFEKPSPLVLHQQIRSRPAIGMVDRASLALLAIRMLSGCDLTCRWQTRVRKVKYEFRIFKFFVPFAFRQQTCCRPSSNHQSQDNRM